MFAFRKLNWSDERGACLCRCRARHGVNHVHSQTADKKPHTNKQRLLARSRINLDHVPCPKSVAGLEKLYARSCQRAT